MTMQWNVSLPPSLAQLGARLQCIRGFMSPPGAHYALEIDRYEMGHALGCQREHARNREQRFNADQLLARCGPVPLALDLLFLYLLSSSGLLPSYSKNNFRPGAKGE